MLNPIVQPGSASIVLARQRLAQNRSLRNLLHNAIFPSGGPNPNPQADALRQLANTFTRYAGTQQTVYDNGGGQAGGISGANLLERQVERVLAQVLGRSPGRGDGSFTSALEAAFPIDCYGNISATPTRSVVSMHVNGNGVAGNLASQLSVEQAALYRQAVTIAGDTQRVLAELEPFAEIGDEQKIEALRALIRSELSELTQEFGRVDKPRPQRVEAYFDQLIGPNGHVIQFGHRAFLDRQLAVPTTTEDEGQLAGFELLRRYIDMLRTAWNNYNQPQINQCFPAFSDRLTRAQTLLPSIAAALDTFMSSMSAVGFADAERRTEVARFTRLAPANAIPPLPDLTVGDLNEWIDRFANIEAQTVLSESGQYGLQSVTDQADRLFLVLAPVLAHVHVLGQNQIGNMPLLAQILTHERVVWTLGELTATIQALANLAA
jgi:hypothetical protein